MKLIRTIDEIEIDMYILLYVHDKGIRKQLSEKEWIIMGKTSIECKRIIETMKMMKYSILFFTLTYEELLEHYVLEHI